MPGVIPPPAIERDAVPRRRFGVSARPVSETEKDAAQPHEDARYSQVLRFPNRRELLRRFPPLIAGLLCIGFSISISVRAELGVAPWDVLHQGLAKATGTSIGLVLVVVGLVVLLAWIPLRQHLG